MPDSSHVFSWGTSDISMDVGGAGAVGYWFKLCMLYHSSHGHGLVLEVDLSTIPVL